VEKVEKSSSSLKGKRPYQQSRRAFTNKLKYRLPVNISIGNGGHTVAGNLLCQYCDRSIVSSSSSVKSLGQPPILVGVSPKSAEFTASNFFTILWTVARCRASTSRTESRRLLPFEVL
jgi:hypothetical protein